MQNPPKPLKTARNRFKTGQNSSKPFKTRQNCPNSDSRICAPGYLCLKWTEFSRYVHFHAPRYFYLNAHRSGIAFANQACLPIRNAHRCAGNAHRYTASQSHKIAPSSTSARREGWLPFTSVSALCIFPLKKRLREEFRHHGEEIAGCSVIPLKSSSINVAFVRFRILFTAFPLIIAAAAIYSCMRRKKREFVAEQVLNILKPCAQQNI